MSLPGPWIPVAGLCRTGQADRTPPEESGGQEIEMEPAFYSAAQGVEMQPLKVLHSRPLSQGSGGHVAHLHEAVRPLISGRLSLQLPSLA